MKTITWEYTCDICKQQIMLSSQKEKDASYLRDLKKTSISVIFTTEQNEGRSVTPYHTIQEVHLCQGCMNRVLSGEIPFAQGAQGYNTYYFKQRKAQSAKKEQTL